MAPPARIVQVVPELAPEIGGVAAYADLLGKALAVHGFETLFLAPRRPGRLARADLRLFEPTAGALVAALHEAAAERPPTAVLLHYVGYGFAARGCPGWLLRGLEAASSGATGATGATGAAGAAAAPLLTILHETWVSGPPWTHRFWLLPRQKNLVHRLERLSRHLLRTRRSTRPGARPGADLLPMPSNVGEPDRAAWPAERPPRLLVFGLPAVRNRLYTAGGEALERFCVRAGVREVHDVGPALATVPATVGALPVLVHGALPAGEISRLLLASRFLAMHYPREGTAKSGVIAAAMAHGCAVLNCGETEPPADDDPWSLWRPAGWDGGDWRAAAEAGYDLYHRGRAWSVVASRVARLLR